MEANRLSEMEKGKSLVYRITLPQIVYVIGIDPGTKTGLALYDLQVKMMTAVMTLQVHQAFEFVRRMHADGHKIFVRVEDARLRKWYGANARQKQQGAGAIKIQCKQWQDFLKSEGISHQMVEPAKIKTKVNAAQFNKLTGWTGRTSNHGRDAGMLVYGL